MKWVRCFRQKNTSLRAVKKNHRWLSINAHFSFCLFPSALLLHLHLLLPVLLLLLHHRQRQHPLLRWNHFTYRGYGIPYAVFSAIRKYKRLLGRFHDYIICYLLFEVVEKDIGNPHKHLDSIYIFSPFIPNLFLQPKLIVVILNVKYVMNTILFLPILLCVWVGPNVQFPTEFCRIWAKNDIAARK